MSVATCFTLSLNSFLGKTLVISPRSYASAAVSLRPARSISLACVRKDINASRGKGGIGYPGW